MQSLLFLCHVYSYCCHCASDQNHCQSALHTDNKVVLEFWVLFAALKPWGWFIHLGRHAFLLVYKLKSLWGSLALALLSSSVFWSHCFSFTEETVAIAREKTNHLPTVSVSLYCMHVGALGYKQAGLAAALPQRCADESWQGRKKQFDGEDNKVPTVNIDNLTECKCWSFDKCCEILSFSCAVITWAAASHWAPTPTPAGTR